MTTNAGHKIKHSIARSTWVTYSWNWLLTLVSRAAEAILTVTILYSTLQVFTDTNPRLDFYMFLAQQIALDAGGIGLIKMANQAKKDGHKEEARKGRQIAIILMVLMGLGVVISDIESKITTTVITSDAHHHVVMTVLDFKHSYPILAVVIEILLLIARGSMAMVYGFTIHDLESSMPEPQTEQSPVEVEELVRKAVDNLQAHMDQTLVRITSELAQMKAAVQQVQNTSAMVPQVDSQTIITEVISQVEGHFIANIKHLEREVEQRVRVSLISEGGQEGANGSVSPMRTGDCETILPMQSGTTLAAPKSVSLPQHVLLSLAEKQPPDEQKAGLANQGEASEGTDAKSVVYALLNEDNSRQVADLQRMTKLPKTTVWRHWNRYHEEHGTRGFARIVAGESEPQKTIETT